MSFKMIGINDLTKDMNQGIDISLEKLSTPVEVLNLDRRICRALQRAGMYTVAEIVLIGKPRLNAAKRVGALTTRRVFEAVSGYVGLAEEQLAETSASLPGTCWDPWAAPSSILRLPDSILLELKHQGYCQVSQLIKARTIGYSSALWLNAKDIDEVDRALNDYLSRAAQGCLLTYVAMESIPEPPSNPSPVLQIHSEDVRSARLACTGRSARPSDP